MPRLARPGRLSCLPYAFADAAARPESGPGPPSLSLSLSNDPGPADLREATENNPTKRPCSLGLLLPGAWLSTASHAEAQTFCGGRAAKRLIAQGIASSVRPWIRKEYTTPIEPSAMSQKERRWRRRRIHVSISADLGDDGVL